MKSNLLITRINEVKYAGESYKNANMLRDKKKEIENFLENYNKLRERIISTTNIFKDLNENEINTDVDFSNIKNSLITLKAKIENDEYDKNIVNMSKSELERINKDLSEAWRTYILGKTSSIDGVIASLGDLISEMPERTKLSDKKLIFNGNKAGISKSIKAIDEYIMIYNELVDKLNLSEDVLRFLKLLTSAQKVTLDNLSIDIFEWLKKSGFSDKITLNIYSRK